MKRAFIATFFALVTPICAGDWLPLTDKFVWPKPGEADPKFESAWHQFDELSQRIKNAVTACWPEDDLPKKIEIAQVDLNGDGSFEVFVGIPAYSGTGGTGYAILTQSDKGFREVGSLLGFGISILPAVDGWHSIEGRSNAGGGHHTRYLLAFNDGKYSFARIENHDLIKKEVTIRKPNKAQQDGADQPATALESKPEGKEKPKPESEGRSQ